MCSTASASLVVNSGALFVGSGALALAVNFVDLVDRNSGDLVESSGALAVAVNSGALVDSSDALVVNSSALVVFLLHTTIAEKMYTITVLYNWLQYFFKSFNL